MRRDKIWGTDTELFCVALILQTDIWVYSVANKWEIFSGSGKSIGEVIQSPPSNYLGSIYIHYTGNHYEPILGVVKTVNTLSSKSVILNQGGIPPLEGMAITRRGDEY